MNNSSYPANMFSSTADHALRALMVLARTEPGRPVRVVEIAELTGAPQNYLSKTMNALARAGIVTSARGPLGGFALAIPAERLTVARVVDLFDEPAPRSRCMLSSEPCSPDRPCSAHGRWTALRAARRAPLDDTTIADLVGDALPTRFPAPAA